MKHTRRQLLERVQAKLKTQPAFVAVYLQRGKRDTQKSYPYVTVCAADSESVITDGNEPKFWQANRDQTRTLPIKLSVWVAQNADAEKLEADLDKYALLIEQALNDNLGGYPIQDVVLTGTTFPLEKDSLYDEEPQLNRIDVTYTIDYITTESNPTD